MKFFDSWLRAEARAVWADPARRIRTLAGFARTEADGARDIARAADRTTDAALKRRLLLHADDELRHAALFEARVREMAEESGGGAAGSDSPFGRAALHDGHRATSLVDDGDIAYVARLHVAERRAESLFRTLRAALAADVRTAEVLDAILIDERRHVAYTAAYLRERRRAGHAGEARRALAAARGSRILDAWRRAGARGGAVFARLFLTAFYFTLLAPFALIAKVSSPRRPEEPPDPRDAVARLRAQY